MYVQFGKSVDDVWWHSGWVYVIVFIRGWKNYGA